MLSLHDLRPEGIVDCKSNPVQSSLPIHNPKLPPAMPVRAAPVFSKLANAHSAFKILKSKISLPLPSLPPHMPLTGRPFTYSL